ncbi:MAG: hypothetical protein WAK97_02285, partial [Pseudolabrys sp.]
RDPSGAMSALGQKQTCAAQNVMSALTPKADMCSALADVRFVPKADMSRFTRSPHRQSRLQGGLGPFYFF